MSWYWTASATSIASSGIKSIITVAALRHFLHGEMRSMRLILQEMGSLTTGISEGALAWISDPVPVVLGPGLRHRSADGGDWTYIWLSGFHETVDPHETLLRGQFFEGYDVDGDGDNDIVMKDRWYENLRLLGDNNDPEDRDRDGMSDRWEIRNGLDPLSEEDGSSDPDGDGTTNLEEFQEGTIPNPDGAFQLEKWQFDEDGNLEIAWRSVPGIYYQLQTIHNEAPTRWESVGPPVFATGQSTEASLGDIFPPNINTAHGQIRVVAGFALDANGEIESPIDLSEVPPEEDSDADSLADHWELNQFQSLAFSAADDPDMDGLNMWAELALGTNPLGSDSDGDGYPDGWELENHLDPTDPEIRPEFPTDSSLSLHMDFENVDLPVGEFSLPGGSLYPAFARNNAIHLATDSPSSGGSGAFFCELHRGGRSTYIETTRRLVGPPHTMVALIKPTATHSGNALKDKIVFWPGGRVWNSIWYPSRKVLDGPRGVGPQ